MGQLEVYNINEIYLNGIVINLYINYLAEDIESNTFESFKAYIYSSNMALKNYVLKSLTIVTPENGIYTSWLFLPIFHYNKLKVTKLIDDFKAWQDLSKIETRVDENILKMQQKYDMFR
jgi:hypothetical protein